MNSSSAAARRVALRVGIPAVVIAALVAGAGTPAFASTSTQVPVASAGFFGGFSGVDPVSATDGWAVGGNGNGMVQRFNGTSWSIVPSPDILDHSNPNNYAGLAGVDATSATNALAVGTSTSVSGPTSVAVALRWNGSAWSRQSVPQPAGTTNNSFNGLKALSASDAWAVGSSGTTFTGLSLAEHFNGVSWSAVPTPNPGTRENILTSVAGTASNDVWAVGYYRNLPYGNRIRLPLILHFDGSAWSQVPSPDSGPGQSTYLYGVAVTSATDAWAVGYGSGQGAFVLHFNGSAWSLVSGPALSSLSGVAARSATDVWVCGSDSSGAAAMAHFNGTSWSTTPVTVTGGVGLPLLNAVAVVDPNTEWAVGSQWDGTTGQSSAIAFRITG